MKFAFATFDNQALFGIAEAFKEKYSGTVYREKRSLPKLTQGVYTENFIYYSKSRDNVVIGTYVGSTAFDGAIFEIYEPGIGERMMGNEARHAKQESIQKEKKVKGAALD